MAIRQGGSERRAREGGLASERGCFRERVYFRERMVKQSLQLAPSRFSLSPSRRVSRATRRRDLLCCEREAIRRRRVSVAGAAVVCVRVGAGDAKRQRCAACDPGAGGDYMVADIT